LKARVMWGENPLRKCFSPPLKVNHPFSLLRGWG
jgi:hypothetical protein